MPRETPTNRAASSRRHRKRMLAVRAMAGETAWLDVPPRWRDSRVVWEDEHGTVLPDAGALALAQRRINQVAGYPRAAGRALGDLAAWLERRRARLAEAKYLAALRAPDLEELAGRCDAQALGRLAQLLAAEALCQNPLPASPTRALHGCGAPALPPLRALLADEAAPLAGRSLGALLLGAIAKGQADAAPEQLSGLQPFFAWGREHSLPPEPALVAALLANADGAALARRCLHALRSSSPFRLAPERLRVLLAAGVPPATVVELAEAAAATEALAARLLEHRNELPDGPVGQRRAVAQRLRREREGLVADLAATLARAAEHARDPALFPAATRLALALLALGTFTPQLATFLIEALDPQATQLAPPLFTPYVLALAELAERAIAAPDARPALTPAQHAHWLATFYNRRTQRLLALLRATGDSALANEALALGVSHELFALPWADAALNRALLAMARDFLINNDFGLASRIVELLAALGDAASVRALWQPLLRALMGAEPANRYIFLDAVAAALPAERRALRDALPRLLRHTPALLRFAVSDPSELSVTHQTITAALALDRELPDEAPAWLDWLLDLLKEHAATAEREWRHVVGLRGCLPLAPLLAAGDFARFQGIARAALEHALDPNEDLLARCHALLRRHTGLREPVAALFRQQPIRCLKLLERVGLIARLGAVGAAPLALLDEGRRTNDEGPTAAVEDTVNNGWQPLLELAPELLADAEAFARTQLLIGGDDGPPAGVRDALQLPRKLAGELAYLQGLLGREPGRADLAARARSLAERLGDEGGLLATARREAAERLAQRSAEAQLAAAEGQVLACFRQRLAQIAGPLPVGLALDDDLLNATLLANDIAANRKLLVRLLRAHLAGDTGWRERHPANAAFLQSLARRGVEPELWLGAQPRVFPLGAVHGGRVRLHAERSPLRILQMGNYSDTCLSFGGINAFSAVANACELNKRVVYAADGAGRIVGRQLIALNAEGGLVGFHVYTNLPDQEKATALRAVFRRYAALFAERCGLALADDGRIPVLFAERWYDDGVVPWDETGGAVAYRSTGVA